jgi:hypothetical protein
LFLVDRLEHRQQVEIEASDIEHGAHHLCKILGSPPLAGALVFRAMPDPGKRPLATRAHAYFINVLGAHEAEPRRMTF